jgi:hypothetical protein
MNIGLIDVDGHRWPNLALMKLSAWHKAQGDTVEWWWGFGEYDRVYMSKVFDTTYSADQPEPLNTREVIRGGTGYGLDNRLPDEVEHIYPDYSIYPELTKETAYGFLTRGCPRTCGFCIVAGKEGRASVKVADIDQWWRGQKYIKLLDPNLLACPEHMDLMGQLADSGAWVDFTQGLDIRLTNARNVELIQHIKTQTVHFAWDDPAQDLTEHFRRFKELSGIKDYRKLGVYVLTNYGDGETVAEKVENALRRIYPLRDLGYNPYVMIFDKPSAPQEIRLLQRWCNNRIIFRSEPDFYKYDPKRGIRRWFRWNIWATLRS